MKIGILLTLTLIVFNDQSNAQLIRDYGIKVAFTSASQTFDYANPPFPGFGPNTLRRSGFNFGFFVEWFDIPFLSVLSQIEYSQRGVGEKYFITENDPIPIRTVTEYHRLDYLSIPLLVKLNFPLGLISSSLVAGPRVDFLLGYQDNQGTLTLLYRDFKKELLGGSFGVGVKSGSLFPIDVSAEFRYNIDFTNSFDNGNLRVKNDAFDLWLGVAF